jgi:xanthine dehydrogenase YagS FAD-binding subunit
MEAFEYASPTTVKAAIALLTSRWGEAEILAGGSDLIGLMKEYVASPKRVVDIKNIRELRGIRQEGQALRIGAVVTLQEVVDSRIVRQAFPAITEALEGITSMQVRNRATVGGNLCQRPRCWYYRAGHGLLARDAQGRSLVTSGDNRYHAVLGNEGPSYFVHPSSLAPALMVLDASARIVGPGGERTLPVSDLYRSPRADDDRETVLQPNEIIVEVLIPESARGRRNAFYKVRQKEAVDWPLASAAVALAMDGTTVRTARIVLGHVAPVPWKATAAEQLLAGQVLNEDTAIRAGEAAVRGARPLSRNAYKIQLARVAVKRALLAAGKGA